MIGIRPEMLRYHLGPSASQHTTYTTCTIFPLLDLLFTYIALRLPVLFVVHVTCVLATKKQPHPVH